MLDKRNYPSWIDPDHIGTHYDGCEQSHPTCAWIEGERVGREQAEVEAKRLRTANAMLEAALKDLHSKHDGRTCGRVQCRSALRDAQRANPTTATTTTKATR